MLTKLGTSRTSGQAGRAYTQTSTQLVTQLVRQPLGFHADTTLQTGWCNSPGCQPGQPNLPHDRGPHSSAAWSAQGLETID